MAMEARKLGVRVCDMSKVSHELQIEGDRSQEDLAHPIRTRFNVQTCENIRAARTDGELFSLEDKGQYRFEA
jgi:hypothetical protein